MTTVLIDSPGLESDLQDFPE